MPLILEVFTPTAAEIERARGIVAACEAAGGNVVEYQGKMIDGPVVKRQRSSSSLAPGASRPIAANAAGSCTMRSRRPPRTQ